MDNHDNRDWDLLITRIKQGRCTPFLGAGACYGVLPLGGDIARRWAKRYEYPLEDTHDLPRVSQFVAVEVGDPMSPKELVQKEFAGVAPPDFDAPGSVHGALARLPLPVYITTNYDDFMQQALRHRHRDPQRAVCLWNKYIRKIAKDENLSIFETQPDFVPTAQKPVVFHLHGALDSSESMVLTEDDYLEFLVNMSRDESLLPNQVERAFARSSLLFLGYGIADLNFRVLFRMLGTHLSNNISKAHISVQLCPGTGNFTLDQLARAQKYLDRYFDGWKIRVYWGTCDEFIGELTRRWQAAESKPAVAAGV